MEITNVSHKDEVLKEILKENESLKKEIIKLDKLLELNMNDFWDVCDQRDWYYEEYRKLKDK
jgi:hypothetical protein